MDESDWLADRFEARRRHLRGVAYRMLGSLSEAEDAVQEAWLHLTRADTSGVANLDGWLTTVVARICLDMLRTRRSRREAPLPSHLPDPVISPTNTIDPEQEALIGDSIGLALLVVLDTLTPAGRVAFVLHDVFGVSFSEIGAIVARSPVAARQLASRARRRVRGAAPEPDADLSQQRAVVNAFIAAAREGDFEALLKVLDPDVILRGDRGAIAAGAITEIRGAPAVAREALAFAQRYGAFAQPVLVNGAAGVLVAEKGKPFSVMGFTVRHDKVAAIDILADPARLKALGISGTDD